MIRLPSIRSKLLALFLVAGAIPIVAVSLIAYFNSIEAVEDMVGNRTQRIAFSIRGELGKKLSRRLDDRIFEVNRPVQDFLLEAHGIRRAMAQAALRKYLSDLFERYGEAYDELVLVADDGMPLLKYHHQESGAVLEELGNRVADLVGAASVGGDAARIGEGPFTGFEFVQPSEGEERRVIVLRANPAEESFTPGDLQAAARGSGLARGEVQLVTDIPLADGTSAFRVVRPVFSNDDGRRLGTLVLRLRQDYLFRGDLATEAFGEYGEIAVVDRDRGSFIFHSRAERDGFGLGEVDPPLGEIVAAPSGRGWSKIGGERGTRLAVVSALDAVPWSVVATALPREFQDEAQRAGMLNLLVASAAVLLAGVVLLVSSGQISRSIQTVTEGAREIAAGNLDLAIDVRTHDEIQILGETFNRMTASLNENIALRERAARDLASLNRTLEDRVRERTHELQSLNEVLNQANRELKELDRLKTHFLATVSHELKTPLTSIKAFAEILMDEVTEVDGPVEMVRFLGIINSETERLGRLIKNLLSLSQIESGRMVWNRSEFDLSFALEAALDGLLPVIQDKRIAVRRTMACPEARVNGDADRIQEVISNLIDNAIKFSEPGGEIHVDCRPEDAGPEAPPRVRIAVRDFGCGVPAAQSDVIFDKFSQVDPSDTRQKGGTGLGLAICKEIVEHHEGTIWVESTPGEGATFAFSLPLAPALTPDGGRLA